MMDMVQSSSTVSKRTLAELLDSNFLLCDHCQQKYNQPVLLPCLHTFCVHCVQQLSTDSDSSEDKKLIHLICPTCKSTVALPGITFKDQNIFIINMCELHKLKNSCSRLCEYCKFDRKKITATTLCLECQDDMCDPCSWAHQRTRVTRNHKLAPYEQICNGLYDHDIRQHQQIMCVVHPSSQLLLFCEVCYKLICKDCKLYDHTEHKVSSVEAILPRCMEQLISFQLRLENRIPAVTEYASFLTTYDSKIKSSQEDCTKAIIEQANLLHQLVDEHKDKLLQQLKQVCEEESKKVQSKCRDLNTAKISLQKNSNFLSYLIQFGKPEEILLVHKPVAERLKQLVHMNPDGLTKKLLTNFLPGSATDQNVQIILGKLTISNVQFDQEDTPATRLTVATVMPSVLTTPILVSTFDVQLETDSVDVWPTGLCITNDNIVIVDRDNKKVKIFTKDGQLKKQFSGQGKHSLGSPFDATILDDGNIAVTDYKKEDVKIFDLSGNCVLTISGHFRHPRGITTNKNGHVVVVDCHLHKILTFDPSSGHLLSTVKAKDKKGNQLLTDPYYITETDTGDLVLTDQAAPNLKVFSPTGDLLGQYGSYGTSQDQVLQPHGVTVDRYGYILVADHHNSRIHLLLPDGKFSKFLLTKLDKLWHPLALAINSSGHLVVAEALGNIKIFKYI